MLANLLQFAKVAVISGGSWHQFEMQLLANLPKDRPLHNLSLLPVCGTQFYQYSKELELLYPDDLTALEKDTIVNSLNSSTKQAGFLPEKTWGLVLKIGEVRSHSLPWGSLHHWMKR